MEMERDIVDSGRGDAEDCCDFIEDAEARQSFALALKESAQRGMTIVEIMVVVAIIGIIGTAIAFGAVQIFGDTQVDAARTQLSTVSKGLDIYYLKNREYPSSLDVLVEEGKLKEKQLQDPWKEPFIYSVISARKYELCSAGEDKSKGTQDDICLDDN